MTMVSPEELALARLTGDVFLHSLPRQTTLATGKNMDRIPVYMDYSKAAGRMATIDTGGQIHLWDPRQWLHVPIVSNPRENRSSIPLSLAFSPGGDKLSFFTEDGTVSVLAAPQPGKP
jgi:WD40 repeat protein